MRVKRRIYTEVVLGGDGCAGFVTATERDVLIRLSALDGVKHGGPYDSRGRVQLG